MQNFTPHEDGKVSNDVLYFRREKQTYARFPIGVHAVIWATDDRAKNQSGNSQLGDSNLTNRRQNFGLGSV